MTAGERGLWVLAGAGGLHVAEEYALDWRSWAEGLSGVHLTWERFWIGNGAFLLFAVVAASIGWRHMTISLSLPSLTLINGVLFHIGPTLVLGRISPGVITSVVLYVPIGTWVLWRARRERGLTARVLATSFLLGAAIMTLPFLFLAVV
jgi:hypothetical protein